MNKFSPNRIAQAFENKKAFIAFITGGDPDIATTERLVVTMAESGVDMIEIGIPFSDPIAEGVVIQKASERALQNGCTVDQLFGLVRRLRERIDLPILFMTYVNPIFVYGKERFMERCTESGVSGIIVPDLPFEEKGELSQTCSSSGITLISMIAPTSSDRIAAIANDAEGFLYCVSSLGVTGVRSEIRTDVGAMINKVRESSRIPCAVGFGISTPEQAQAMSRISDGIIIGSAIVRLVEQYGADCIEPAAQFARSIRSALDEH